MEPLGPLASFDQLHLGGDESGGPADLWIHLEASRKLFLYADLPLYTPENVLSPSGEVSVTSLNKRTG